jgi:hypothetical protein
MSDHGHDITMTTRPGAQNAEAVLGIVVGYSLDASVPQHQRQFRDTSEGAKVRHYLDARDSRVGSLHHKPRLIQPATMP